MCGAGLPISGIASSEVECVNHARAPPEPRIGRKPVRAPRRRMRPPKPAESLVERTGKNGPGMRGRFHIYASGGKTSAGNGSRSG